jgi:YidC/Oxa1 family membrane protein insertase
MDKNSIIGFALIFVLVIGYLLYNREQASEFNDRQKTVQDSLAMIEQQRVYDSIYKQKQIDTGRAIIHEDKIIEDNTLNLNTDSLKLENLSREFGPFVNSVEGEEKVITIENEHIIVSLTNRGGKILNVELKDYKAFSGDSLLLFMDTTNHFGLGIPTQNNFVFTDPLFFETTQSSFEVEGEAENSISYRLNAGQGRYLEYVYTLKGNSNFVKFDINMVGFDKVISNRDSKFTLNWKTRLRPQEREIDREQGFTTIYYQTAEDKDVDYISEKKDVQDEPVKFPLKWVSFKQQFFNSTLIADESFLSGSMWTFAPEDTVGYLKALRTKLYLPFKGQPEAHYGMNFYFGPIGYNSLKKLGLGMDKMVPMGGFGLGQINRFIILPVFNFFSRFTNNYGIIIFLLALFIKIILSPLTFKSFKSTAKMRVLKPEIDELKAKYKNDAQKLQMEQMKLYRKTGVNMFGGCLPMLLQMPILIAMYRFFPAALNLRQASFLWAQDLSTYDAIIEFSNFSIPFYGDHVSLFTILMALTSILYAKVNAQMTPTAGAGQMQMMQYIMPFFLIFIFNSFSAGLTYYYLLYNILSFAQSALFKRFFINENKLRAQIEERKKKPVKKSKWAMRLEEMQKSQQQQRGGKKK